MDDRLREVAAEAADLLDMLVECATWTAPRMAERLRAALAASDPAPAPLVPEGPSTCPACGGNRDHPWWTVGDDSYDCAPVAQDSPDPLRAIEDALRNIERVSAYSWAGHKHVLAWAREALREVADLRAAIEGVSRDH